MDLRDNDREIIVRVRLNQAEYDILAAMSDASGRPKGAILRDVIYRNNPQVSPTGRSEQCQAQPL
jgi:hypothetical protein